MKEITVKVYKFDELDENAQRKVIEYWQSRRDFAEPYSSEYEATLEEFEKMMGIKVKNWSVDSCRYDYRVVFDLVTLIPNGDYREVDGDEIHGKYLWRYLMNNVWDNMFPRKKFYDVNAGYDREKKRWNKQRFSRVIREDWKDCVLTGMCYDYDILKPIADYLSKPYNDNYTLRDLVEDCLDNFFTAWRNEIEYDNSYEGVSEWIENCCDDEYLEDGSVFRA